MNFTKIILTRCQIFHLRCTKFNFSWGSSPDLAGKLTTLPRPRNWIWGKGKGKKKGKGKDRGRGKRKEVGERGEEAGERAGDKGKGRGRGERE